MEVQSETRERRAAYRTILRSNDALEVGLKNSAGDLVRGEVADVSSVGTSVVFGLEVAPALAVEERTIIFFTSQLLPDPVEVHAKVVARAETEASRSYRFKFDKQVLLRNPRLQRLFNRRDAHRISPGPEELIEVRFQYLEGDNSKALPTARCKDISATGMGVEAERGMDAALRDVDIVAISFELPGAKKRQTLVVSIVDRRLRNGLIDYGLRFDAERSADFRRHQEEIITYVMRRRQEEFAGTGTAAALIGDLYPVG